MLKHSIFADFETIFADFASQAAEMRQIEKHLNYESQR
jgi:hypothetical protein